MFWNYNRRDEGLRTLEAEINGYELAHQGQLPHEDNPIIDGYVSMLAGAGQFAAGETVWKKHLEHPESSDQRKYFKDRLGYLYNQAFQQFNFGYASAIAYFLFLVIIVVTVIQFRVGRRFTFYRS